MQHEQITQLQAAAQDLHTTSEEYRERIPFYFWMSLVSPAVVIALFVAGVLANNRGPWIPAAVMAVAMLIFWVSLFYVRVRSKQTAAQFEEVQAKINDMRAKENEVPPVEQMMIEAGCQTVRELEAKYERYRSDTLELESLLKAGEIQEREAQEAEHRVSQLFEIYRAKFRETGEELANELDVEEAAGRAVARYQEYRDAKRRFAENREQVERREAEAAPVRERLESLRKEEITLALEVRRMMRENGYPEESKHDRPLSALRSYRIRNAQQREKRGRVDVLQEKKGPLDRQIQMEERDLAEHDAALARRLAAAGVQSVEQWQQRAEQAREYRAARQELTALQEQLAGLLKGETLDGLRADADADDPVLESPQQSAGELQQVREALAQAIDARNKEEHALHLIITERSAGMRSLNEIEEDRTVLEARIRDLELEMRAATYAMTLIESIAQDKHSRIAPRLAAAASRFLDEITGGAYQELLVSRDLEVSVRIPQLQRMSDNPEYFLSKGTVDQIYLALRLAMVQALSENGESIPMLLDDPFANYDDDRLGRTIALLLQLAGNNQILLFSCREDVARAAEILNVPIVRL